MGTRNLTSGFAAALQASSVQPFFLLQMDFSSGTAYACGLAHDVSYGGNTYTGALGWLDIDTLTETATSVQGLRVSLTGVPASSVALALTERVQGRLLTLRMAVLDAAGAVQVDSTVWQGLMDTIAIDDAQPGATVVITAEHMLATWDRPRPVRYTDAQQQALSAGDKGLEYVAAMAEANIVWPGKAFFA